MSNGLIDLTGLTRGGNHWIRNFMLPQKYVKNFALAKKIWILQPFPQNISRQYFPLKNHFIHKKWAKTEKCNFSSAGLLVWDISPIFLPSGLFLSLVLGLDVEKFRFPFLSNPHDYGPPYCGRDFHIKVSQFSVY